MRSTPSAKDAGEPQPHHHQQERSRCQTQPVLPHLQPLHQQSRQLPSPSGQETSSKRNTMGQGGSSQKTRSHALPCLKMRPQPNPYPPNQGYILSRCNPMLTCLTWAQNCYPLSQFLLFYEVKVTKMCLVRGAQFSDLGYRVRAHNAPRAPKKQTNLNNHVYRRGGTHRIPRTIEFED